MERKGMKRNDFLRNSLIFSEILRFSLIFFRNDRKNDRKRPRKWGIQLGAEE